MKRLRSLSFKYQVLFGLLMVAMVPLLVCNILIVNIFSASLQTQATDAAERQLAEVQRKLDDMFLLCEEVTGKVCQNALLARALVDSTGASTEVYLALYRTAAGLPAEAALSLYDAGGKLRFSTDFMAASAMLPVRWGVLHKAQRAENGTMVYYDVENFAGAPVQSSFAMLTAQTIHSADGALLGYAVVGLPAETFQSLFAGAYSDQGAILLLDDTGALVFSSLHTLPEGELEALRTQFAAGSFGMFTRQGNQFYTAHSAPSGFYLVLRQPAPFTGAALRRMQSISIVTALLSFGLCFLVAAFISRNLSRPISRLSDAMGRAQQGDLSVRVPVHREDELGRLSESFNQMTEDLKLYMDKTLQQQHEVDEAQIRLLQAQLNPHFLYNTLDTVKWLARIHNIPEIASISSNLAIILRQCVSSEQFVTLRKELDMAQSYIDIQRIRFSGRFQYVADLPKALEDCLIPKLIVQPLVENAILHGLADKESGYIYVYAAAREEDVLQLSVTDDGCGMAPDAIARLNEGGSKMVEGHLGLYNVSHIIQMHYGARYGLRAHSLPGVGTTVTLELPLQRGDEHA